MRHNITGANSREVKRPKYFKRAAGASVWVFLFVCFQVDPDDIKDPAEEKPWY